MNQIYRRGEIYYADLGDQFGSEQRGYRPVVIVQNDVGNLHSPTVIVASITSKTDARAKLPTHHYLGASCGLERPSVILTEQLDTTIAGAGNISTIHNGIQTFLRWSTCRNVGHSLHIPHHKSKESDCKVTLPSKHAYSVFQFCSK